MNGAELSFDTVAADYARLRPDYVEGVYNAIFAYAPITSASRAVEIGIGGGQATLPFLQTGCELTAVECGANFAALCRAKFNDHPNFSIITSKFEDAQFANDAYDIVFSASAFHWIAEATGYPKVFAMLKSGGTFARFANHPFRDKGQPLLARKIDDIYKEYYYPYHKMQPQTPREYTAAQAKALADAAGKYGFTDIRYALFQRTRTFNAKDYCALLGTYSDHLIIEKETRRKFFAEIKRAINDNGGRITVYDTIDLQLARKP